MLCVIILISFYNIYIFTPIHVFLSIKETVPGRLFKVRSRAGSRLSLREQRVVFTFYATEIKTF